MCVECAFRLARCARCVNDHQRVFSGGNFCRSGIRLGCGQRRPPVVASRFHVHILSGALQHDHVFQRGNLFSGFIGNGFHFNRFAAPKGTIRREERFRICIHHARDNGARAIARKKRENNSTDLGNGKQGNDDLWGHRHEDANGIAFAQAK